jgi:hypothetical protein
VFIAADGTEMVRCPRCDEVHPVGEQRKFTRPLYARADIGYGEIAATFDSYSLCPVTGDPVLYYDDEPAERGRRRLDSRIVYDLADRAAAIAMAALIASEDARFFRIVTLAMREVPDAWGRYTTDYGYY